MTIAFDYPEMSTTSFRDMRFYETPDGKFYPSITTILGNTQLAEKREGLEKWKKSLGKEEADKVLHEAGRHGTAVHLLTERYLKGEQLVNEHDEITPGDMGSFNALKTKLKKIEQVVGQEVALYSDILGVAGRTDLIAQYKGKLQIIDFKTSMSIKSDRFIEDYKLQLCAYAIMHNEMFGTDIKDGSIFMSSGSGFPQEFNVNLLDYVDVLRKRVTEFYVKMELKLAA